MNNSLRNEYLKAMGVQQWVARDAVAALDSRAWTELEKQVSGCTLCGLQESRTRTVFGVGNHDADWLVIGEAPGADEDRQGEPFVGRAGQLLTEMLFAIGLQRDDVFICNILKCRPPGNRNPSTEEVSHCHPYLQRQIELIRPRLILAVGGVAANSLLDMNEKVGSLRGKVHNYGVQEIPLVVTYHPAYLLRSPQEKRKAWDDLQFARSVCANGNAG
ncbi:MAG: uracil-DNA glycosylase [Gammaproteobacteria bacterium]|nr:uracil-DNA glycosylase [Gammaproteobacteria bacterium]